MADTKLELHEGKAKIVYQGPSEQEIIQYFKDDATAFNAKKKGTIKNKGVINNTVSSFLMQFLQEKGINTHFIKKLNDREQLNKKLQIIPVEFVVRNWSSGSICKRFGIDEGILLKNNDRPLIEFYLKDDDLGDPLISAEHIFWSPKISLSNDQLNFIKYQLLVINQTLSDLFYQNNMTLVDYKLEFGYFYDSSTQMIVLGDEISSDTCRIWDGLPNEYVFPTPITRLDKDLFRKDLGNEINGYEEVAKRFGLI